MKAFREFTKLSIGKGHVAQNYLVRDNVPIMRNAKIDISLVNKQACCKFMIGGTAILASAGVAHKYDLGVHMQDFGYAFGKIGLAASTGYFINDSTLYSHIYVEQYLRILLEESTSRSEVANVNKICDAEGVEIDPISLALIQAQESSDAVHGSMVDKAFEQLISESFFKSFSTHFDLYQEYKSQPPENQDHATIAKIRKQMHWDLVGAMAHGFFGHYKGVQFSFLQSLKYSKLERLDAAANAAYDIKDVKEIISKEVAKNDPGNFEVIYENVVNKVSAIIKSGDGPKISEPDSGDNCSYLQKR